MVILNLYGIPFHAVVVFRSEHDILFKSASTYCVLMWKWFRRFYFSGTGGCLPERQACLAGCPVLYGPNIYCGLLPRDVCEMVGTWLCQIFHQCLVLAWFCHSYGRPIFIICKNEKIFFSVELSKQARIWKALLLTFYTNVLMANLFLVTDFSFDSYVYLCLFSLQLILVQIQIDSAYLLKTEIAETSSDWILDANLFHWILLLFTESLCLSLMLYIYLFIWFHFFYSVYYLTFFV